MSVWVALVRLFAMEQETPGLAAYQRVAETIKREIRSGTLSPGDRLPSNRGVAEKYEVALGTAQKALSALEEDGWITTTPSVGTFVNSVPAEPAQKNEDLASAVAELRATVADLSARLDALEQQR